MHLPQIYFATGIFLSLVLVTATYAPAGNELEAERLLKNMETAYAGIADYRKQVDMKTRVDDGSSKKQKLLYNFKKPYRIRIDFESPYLRGQEFKTAFIGFFPDHGETHEGGD